MDRMDEIGMSALIYDFINHLPDRAIVTLVFTLGALEECLEAKKFGAIGDRAIKRAAEYVLEKIEAAELEAPEYGGYYPPLRQAIKKLLQ